MIPNDMANAQELLPALERALTLFASYWRGLEEGSSNARKFERDYGVLLRHMIALGFHSPLDIDAELPDEFMPDEYLRLRAAAQHAASPAGD